jgi:hypothetical protein
MAHGVISSLPMRGICNFRCLRTLSPKGASRGATESIADRMAQLNNRTPTFFINGRRYAGPHDLAGLTAALQQALAEARMAW